MLSKFMVIISVKIALIFLAFVCILLYACVLNLGDGIFILYDENSV